MSERPQVQLLLNEMQFGHRHVLSELLVGAKKLECMVAFAKTSGLGLVTDALKESLSAGMVARFAVGLDFYQTEPKLLRTLFQLSHANNLKLYLSNSKFTFHPKIYAVSDGAHCTVVIGSANLTSGGLQGNYEASAKIDDNNGSLMRLVSRHIDDLIDQSELILATKANIDEYERLHDINKVQQGLAKRRVERANTVNGVDLSTLRDILAEMKLDASENGFGSHKTIRTSNRKAAARSIVALAATENLDTETFLERYEELIAFFHSGGLHRGKNIIAENAGRFQSALAAIVNSEWLEPADAFGLLRGHFQHIPRAGVNVLTEILHAINCKRFAVMNQNAVAGLRLANIFEFPRMPTKGSVNPDRYARFCECANMLRNELGLADFTELDALFNYAYWGYENDEEADE